LKSIREVIASLQIIKCPGTLLNCAMNKEIEFKVVGSCDQCGVN